MTAKREHWVSVKDELPEEGVTVSTMIADELGVRNQARLVRRGSVWFLENKSLYVYYAPTHWAALEELK